VSGAPREAPRAIEPLLFTTAQVATLLGGSRLTNASGFFFEREGRTYLVTSRHVLFDAGAGHFPDAISFAVHTSAVDLTRVVAVVLPLYSGGQGLWRQAQDSGGEVDVAVLPLDPAALPAEPAFTAFGPEHLLDSLARVQVGADLLLLGYPLGFQDTLHYLPVARHAIVASAFGVRFQGKGQFLTDARAHRGSSGGPLVMRSAPGTGLSCWKLLGVHSSRFDVGSRDNVLDEALGLNCAWYADVLMALTDT
jgi:S1-C subfamily serine protease